MAHQNEICCFGVQRSGNHGIINWIASLFDEPKTFLNSRHQSEKSRWRRNCFAFHKPVRSTSNSGITKYSHLQKRPQNLLIYSIENQTPKMIDENLRNRHHLFGESENFHVVLILRDPFNTYASRIQDEYDKKHRQSCCISRNCRRYPENWVQYAKLHLAQKRVLGVIPTCILFNKWVYDQDYRQNICEQLGGTYTEQELRTVPKFGGGSSFDKQQFDGKAHEMKLTERWKGFVNDPRYLRLFNRETIELSERIFGHIKGTEEIIRLFRNS